MFFYSGWKAIYFGWVVSQAGWLGVLETSIWIPGQLLSRFRNARLSSPTNGVSYSTMSEDWDALHLVYHAWNQSFNFMETALVFGYRVVLDPQRGGRQCLRLGRRDR